MPVTKNKLLLLVQSALCLILVAILAAGVIGIYRQGIAEKQENPLSWVYTREKAVEALKPVAPVFLLAVAITVACAVLNVRDENADKPVKDVELNRNLMLTRVAQSNEAMKKEQALQKKLLFGGWAGFGVCMLPVGLYMTDGSHFLNGDLEEMIGSLAVHVFPWIMAEPKKKTPARNYSRLRWLLLAVAVVFIVAGIYNGSMTAVINKAIRICTECVGLG